MRAGSPGISSCLFPSRRAWVFNSTILLLWQSQSQAWRRRRATQITFVSTHLYTRTHTVTHTHTHTHTYTHAHKVSLSRNLSLVTVGISYQEAFLCQANDGEYCSIQFPP